MFFSVVGCKQVSSHHFDVWGDGVDHKDDEGGRGKKSKTQETKKS